MGLWDKGLARGAVLGSSALLVGFAEPALADDKDNRLRKALQGLEATYTGEVWRNTQGGLKRGSRYLDNLDLTWEVESETLWAAPGGTLFVYGLYNNAAELSGPVLGDAQTVSNIDGPQAFRLFEAWYEQSLFDDRLSVLIGLHDLNSEFDVLDTRGLFIQSAHGIGTEFAQTGENGPSIFPVSSLTFRAHWKFNDAWSVRGAVYDGVPGDPDRPSKTVIDLGNGDGVLGVVELAYESATGFIAKAGYWRYTADFDDLNALDPLGAPLRRSGNDGFYVAGELPVTREPGDPDQGLTVFVRYGRAENEINAFESFLGAGGVYTGLLPGRPNDQLGFAVAIAKNGDPFLDAQALAGMPAMPREFNLELTYHAQITDWLALQPDIQYVINPGTDPSLKDVLVFGLRFEISRGLF